MCPKFYTENMRSKIRRTTFDDLPEDAAGNILSRLSVRHLVQLKCVCKFWRNVLSSRWFISLQLKRSISDSTHHYLLRVNKRESPYNSFCTFQSPYIRVNLDEFKNFGPPYVVAGSVNGLVCIVIPLARGMRCFIWNPSIKQHRSIPKSSVILVSIKKRAQVTFGFGHEPNSDDYKVVRVLNFNADKGMPLTLAEVYSLNSNTWKEVKSDFPLNITRRGCDVTLNGFTYWLVKKGNGNENPFLASFDLRREVFGKIAVPDATALESENYSAVNFKGRLALLVCGSRLEPNKCLHVWMQEDESGGVGVWNKTFTFMMDFKISHHWGLTNGNIVVQNAPNFPFLYDPERKVMKMVGVNWLDGVQYYVESLVPVRS